MSKNYDTEKYKKTFIAAGVTCLPVAAMFITYAVFLIFYITGLFSSNMKGDTAFAILALIFILLKPFLMFVYIFFAIISGLIATGYICSGIALIKRSHNNKIENSLALSFVISVLICAFSIYPFIINILRIIAHGIMQEYLFGFFVAGFIPLSLSVTNIVFNRKASKKQLP